MADPPDGVDGLLGRLFPGNNAAALYGGALSDPATQAQLNQRGLLAMAGSFADSAMPTRMPTPFGAVLGHAAAAMGTSGDAVMQARLQEAQSEQARAQAALSQSDVDISKRIPGLLAAAYGKDGGGTAPAGPGGIPIPGTIGTGPAATAPINTGRGPVGVAIPAGTPTATNDPKLSGTENLNNLALAAAPIALPEGYTVKMTSGDRPGAVAPGGGASQHATANAADFQIYGPDGTKIDNVGPDTTGLYGKLAVTMRKIADPAIKPWLAWGGNFTTASGKPDLMHFDFAGDRGHLGSLGQMEQTFDAQSAPRGGAPPPVQLAQANTGTMTDAAPQPGLLGPTPPVPPGGPVTSPNQPIGNPLAPVQSVPRPPMPPAPPPPGAPPPGSGAPPSLVPAPSPAPVPPSAMQPPPQVAAGPAAPGAPGGTTGVPSPEQIRAAQALAAAFASMHPPRPLPADLAAIASWNIDTAKEERAAQIKLHTTPFRPYGSILNADGSWTVAPGPPMKVGGPPTPSGQPTENLVYPSTTPGGTPAVSNLGVTGASPKDIAGQQAAPKPIELDPTKTVLFPPGTPGAQQWIDAQTKGQKLPDNVQVLANGGVQVGATTPTTGQIDKTQEDFFKLKDSAQAARQGIYETQQLRQQLHQIGMSGPATEAYANLGAWAQSLGVLTPDQVKQYIGVSPANAEAADKMSQDLLGEVLKSTFPSRITNADIASWKNTVPRGTMLEGAYDLLIDKILMPKLEQQVGRYSAVAGLAASGDPQLRTYSGTLETYDKANPIGSFVHQYAYGPDGHRLRLDKNAQGQPAWVDDIKTPVQP